jgi:hypothetical protein
MLTDHDRTDRIWSHCHRSKNEVLLSVLSAEGQLAMVSKFKKKKHNHVKSGKPPPPHKKRAWSLFATKRYCSIDVSHCSIILNYAWSRRRRGRFAQNCDWWCRRDIGEQNEGSHNSEVVGYLGFSTLRSLDRNYERQDGDDKNLDLSRKQKW